MLTAIGESPMTETKRTAQIKARKELFPNAKDRVVCRRCNRLWKNPIIYEGVSDLWCDICRTEVIAELRAKNKAAKKRKRKRKR